MDATQQKRSPKQLRGVSLGTKLSEAVMRDVRSRGPAMTASQPVDFLKCRACPVD
jgi:hypothetical protein